MNKKLKRIISFTVAFAAIATIAPSKNMNFFGNAAYAADSERAYLDDIDIDEGDIDFSKSDTYYKVKVKSSVDELKIETDADSDYDVEIDGDDGLENTVDLDRGNNTIRIKVKDRTGEKDPVTYTLSVTRGSSYDDDDDDDDDDEDNIYLDTLSLDKGSISFSKSKSNYVVNVDSSVDEIEIKARPEYSSDDVSIDGHDVDEDDDNYRRKVSLKQGTNIIEVRVEDDDNDNERTYTLYINRGTSTLNTSGKEDFDQDSIYLDKLLIDAGSVPIGFTRRVTSYAVDVKKECDEIIITAEPDDSGDVVRVNGDKVDRNYKKLVKLNEGKNEIKVKVSNEDDDFDDDDDYEDNFEQRIYTITVYRGTSQGTAQSNNTKTTTTNTTKKCNDWVSVNGKWQYNDSLGNPVKNTWYYNKNDGKNYYLDVNGNMLTGWQYINGSWYYLQQSGAAQTGWQLINGKWYCLDMTGSMLTGWFKDRDGKWYYLDPSSGQMVVNTIIGGYKLGANGALI